MTDLKTWVIWCLRKASYRWPPRQAALREAAVSKVYYLKHPGEKVSKLVRNFYKCAKCKLAFSRKGVSIDHVDPVVDPRRGWQGFDEYIKRMFCGKDGFQILCGTDHDEKTARERTIRTAAKRRMKK